MPAQPFQSLLQLLHTTDDVERTHDAIDKLLTALYKTDGKPLSEKMDDILPSQTAQAIKDIIHDASIDPKNLEEVKRLLTSLKTSLGTLRTISLTLAFDPPQNVIDDISDRIKKDFGTDTVMEISIQPHILGGAVIVANGRYIDKSLKKKLDILFEVKKSEITKMISDL